MKQYKIITTIFHTHEYVGEQIYDSYYEALTEVLELNEKAKRLGVLKFYTHRVVEYIPPKKKKWWER